ncbi:MAG: UTP--glucose-1-phosphate uridylyltransferase [Deltaproteobacteria bacterium]|nr:MAG: UTP--glucose-1-phosphate uridylyltransferase [Deltaproteobacteria bacterium]
MRFDWDAIDAELRPILGGLPGLSIDRDHIEQLAAGVAAGRLRAASNRLRESPEPAGPDDVDDLERVSEAQRSRFTRIGGEAIARGQVAVAVLNGGMATRFGGAVKGTVEAFGSRSFLEIKLAQAHAQGPVPVLVMNSFATHAATLAFLEARDLTKDVHPFLQSVSLRLTPEGELFRTDDGALSPYAPGHGDFPEALRRCGLLTRLAERGIRAVTLSNVDNLGAELDPQIVGYHLAHERPVTIEVSGSVPGDVGGAPARVGNRLQVVEGFRFPAGYDFDRLRYFNTNTFVFSPAALETAYPLNWYYVEKQVEGRTAVQFERLVGEISAFVPAAYLAVPRGGRAGRYFPVKDQQALEALRADRVLVERFSRR